MGNHRTLLAAVLVLAAWNSLANGQQKSKPIEDGKKSAPPTRICSVEKGINVCRNAVSIPVEKKTKVDVKSQAVATPGPSTMPGKLLLLLDIPSNTFARLAANPEDNRKYRRTTFDDYRPADPAPPGAGDYSPPTGVGPPVWKYHPKKSFAYQAKRDWTYDRDVFGRMWRQKIQHDTRVEVVPIEKPGVYLLPVAEAR